MPDDTEAYEVVTLVLGIGVLLFLAAQRRRFRDFPRRSVFYSGFLVLIGAWLCTNVEGYYHESLFNTLEHLSYALSSYLLMVWCVLVFSARGEQGG